MKPFLGVDLTLDKKNERFNGEEFLIQQPSNALADILKDSTDKADETIEKSKLPLPLRIFQYACGIAVLLIITGILRADVPIFEAYGNAPGLFWACGICAIVWLILVLLGKQKAKTVLETDESTQTFSNLDGVIDAVYSELAVPSNAKSIDILSFFYKIKNDKIKVKEKGMQMFQYFNPEFKIFADNENLYLANLEGKYAFPLASIVKIHNVKKHIRIAGWNKKDPYNVGVYKKYKIVTDNYGCIHCNQYHIVEINHNGESFGIFIPCYELPIINKFIK